MRWSATEPIEGVLLLRVAGSGWL